MELGSGIRLPTARGEPLGLPRGIRKVPGKSSS